MSLSFENKVAVITGAGNGLGRSHALLLSSLGARIVANDLGGSGDGEGSDETVAENVVKEIREAGGEAVANGDSVTEGSKIVECALDNFGSVDIVINNAGIIRRGPITEATDDDYVTSFAVNVEAPFRICRAAIPILAKAGGGAIVNVASCWGVHPGPNHPIYCMSKAALASMTQCLGHDHAHQGIRINAVCPNEVDTPMLRSGFASREIDPDTAIASLNASVPLGHIAQPQEIADVVVFLVSESARYICGTLVEINGGKAVH